MTSETIETDKYVFTSLHEAGKVGKMTRPHRATVALKTADGTVLDPIEIQSKKRGDIGKLLPEIVSILQREHEAGLVSVDRGLQLLEEARAARQKLLTEYDVNMTGFATAGGGRRMMRVVNLERK